MLPSHDQKYIPGALSGMLMSLQPQSLRANTFSQSIWQVLTEYWSKYSSSLLEQLPHGCARFTTCSNKYKMKQYSKIVTENEQSASIVNLISTEGMFVAGSYTDYLNSTPYAIFATFNIILLLSPICTVDIWSK